MDRAHWWGWRCRGAALGQGPPSPAGALGGKGWHRVCGCRGFGCVEPLGSRSLWGATTGILGARGVRWCPAARVWLSWGRRRSRLELIQGRRLCRCVPGARRSSRDCAAFSHTFPRAVGHDLQRHRGGSWVTLRSLGMGGAALRGDWCGSGGRQEWQFGIKAVPAVVYLGRQVGIWES